MMPNPVKRLLFAGALLSVPVTVYGLTDTYFEISNFGSIGSNTMWSGGYSSFAVGFNNLFAGSGSTGYSAAIGYGLQVYGMSSLVVGQYNQPNSSAYFIVGKGSSSTVRSNAMEVLSNGTVNIPGTANIGKVPDRGGVSMGAFTTP